MLFCSVTVWYNPDDSNAKNILTYSSLCDKCYIVDNSDGDNSSLAAKIPNSVYIPLNQNLGIAAALNAGCSRALKDGFEWCMTMDQDSSWEQKALAHYFELCTKNASETNVSFCPTARYEMPTSYLGDTKRFLRSLLRRGNRSDALPSCKDSLLERSVVDCCITSGNVIFLAAWKKIGGFYEPFFIDEVDFEFCFRLGEKGFKIIKFENCVMGHVLGSPRKTFYPCVSHHSGVRLYYIFRNAFFLKKMHPNYYKKMRYSEQIRNRLMGLVFNFNFFQLRYFFMARRDFKRGKQGKFSM